jgi:hypothetical protein
MKNNLGIKDNPHTMKVIAQLVQEKMSLLRGLPMEYKDYLLGHIRT